MSRNLIKITFRWMRSQTLWRTLQGTLHCQGLFPMFNQIVRYHSPHCQGAPTFILYQLSLPHTAKVQWEALPRVQAQGGCLLSGDLRTLLKSALSYLEKIVSLFFCEIRVIILPHPPKILTCVIAVRHEEGWSRDEAVLCLHQPQLSPSVDRVIIISTTANTVSTSIGFSKNLHHDQNHRH